MKNFLKTTLFLTLLTLLLMWVGAVLGGRVGVMIAFGFAILMNFGAYWFSDKIVLSMYKAQPVIRQESPMLYGIVEKLCKEASLPLPKICIVPTMTPNAFATGRDPNHAAVCVTQGILDILSEDELEGVLAHELAHVKNRDTLTQAVVATIAGAVSMIAYMARWAAIFGMGGRGGRRDSSNIIGLLAMTIIAPIAAMLIQLAISRTREYQADATGSGICKKPLSLASALEKLQNANKAVPMHANTNTAHLFIVNPLSSKGLASLFRTHPLTEDRVERLQRIADEKRI